MFIFYECKQIIYANLDFYFWCKCLLSRCRCKMSIWCTCSPFRDAIYDANVLCRDEDMKFIPDGASAHIQIAMQMSPYKDGDACLVVQMPSNGHVMMQMLLVRMLWCKCPLGACYDANVRLGVFHDANVPLVHAMMRMPLWWCNECECPLRYAMNANVSLRVGHDANVRLGVCHGVNAPLWVCNDANVHVGMSWCKCSCGYVMM